MRRVDLPHLRREDGRWMCMGCYWFGYGYTPAAAYKRWQELVRIDGVSRCLSFLAPLPWHQ